MANIKSAKKRVKVNIEKNINNNNYKAPMRTAIKNVEKAVAAKDKEKALKDLQIAFKTIDKATDNGIIKDNTRARYKSRLTKAVNAL